MEVWDVASKLEAPLWVEYGLDSSNSWLTWARRFLSGRKYDSSRLTDCMQMV